MSNNAKEMKGKKKKGNLNNVSDGNFFDKQAEAQFFKSVNNNLLNTDEVI